ncbi:hypothetical protein N7489_007770 [Penicillium chrysogenum]|uniref:F-box domain-containing protein n=1 Tax=Penicillium chrysogenum TaxID=5076 RepID=A0ABQ8WB58_PENCH|nr:uncharacterized protein N7489_007770 [Penicillium chrysogenum]KAJ5237679.1 hypothetical protein N7489_007770 [Penicillium chrysogenum]KAJ5262056.1 hypothetical protein N7505_008923 [Penicillium chrysogenum]
MDRAEDKSTPQHSGVAQLGTFAKLPLELRWTIWESVFDEIHSASFALAILRCSRYLYQEISDHLFEDFEHEFQVAGGLRFNFTTRQTQRQGWELKNIEAIRCHLHTFPWRKIRGEMFVNISPPPQEDPGQVVQIWQKVNQLIDALNTAPSAPSVWVSLLEDWSRDEKPQESITYTNGYRPDHDIAIIPFVRLSNWYYRIPPAYSATIATERDLREESRSLLYKNENDCPCNGWCFITTAPRDWLIDTRIFLDTKLDDIPGETAAVLRLERFRTWGPGYEKQFVTDLRTRRHIVLKHDPMLRAAITRYRLFLCLKPFPSHDDPEKLKAAWIQQWRDNSYAEPLWSGYFGDSTPSLTSWFVDDSKFPVTEFGTFLAKEARTIPNRVPYYLPDPDESY